MNPFCDVCSGTDPTCEVCVASKGPIFTPPATTLRNASDIIQAMRTELAAVTAERDKLRRQRTEFDCRFTLGNVADFSGSHCPLGEPCLRCESDRYREALKQLRVELLHHDASRLFDAYGCITNALGDGE